MMKRTGTLVSLMAAAMMVSTSLAPAQDMAALEAAVDPEGHDLVQHAKHYCYKVLPIMNDVRKYADALEELVADDLWPLPTYQEMLFIK